MTLCLLFCRSGSCLESIGVGRFVDRRFTETHLYPAWYTRAPRRSISTGAGCPSRRGPRERTGAALLLRSRPPPRTSERRNEEGRPHARHGECEKPPCRRPTLHGLGVLDGAGTLWRGASADHRITRTPATIPASSDTSPTTATTPALTPPEVWGAGAGLASSDSRSWSRSARHRVC